MPDIDTIRPGFDLTFQDDFDTLSKWRRDVRRFKTEPLPTNLVDDLLELAALAPSVGNSQPWRFVKITSAHARKSMRDHFQVCNQDALEDYHGEKTKQYAQLKLSGMDQAPTQIAVFCDQTTQLGHGLGKKTKPETLGYSVVMAVHTLWLAARARGVGVGWVSILDPRQVETILSAPQGWSFVAYLCIGWPEEEHQDPELVRHGWQKRVDIQKFIIER
ncbi:MAG: 5,6-dimethylbenzimidazole synthase [Magnetovibrio sp.]|nr:5,6-dimethylbenzimidazole synthase [Magnetovibrio sp.]